MTNWYYHILNEVVKPFMQENDATIEKFFFFHYEEDYSIQPEPNCERKFEVGIRVRYIRLRVKAKDENLGNLEKSLLELVKNSQTTLEHEKCEYDVSGDLGNRFGQTRTDLTVNYLDAFARMVLSLLTPNNQLENGGKPYSTVHLVHNMIGTSISVTCANCGTINSVPMITAFECQRCHALTYL